MNPFTITVLMRTLPVVETISVIDIRPVAVQNIAPTPELVNVLSLERNKYSATKSCAVMHELAFRLGGTDDLGSDPLGKSPKPYPMKFQFNRFRNCLTIRSADPPGVFIRMT